MLNWAVTGEPGWDSNPCGAQQDWPGNQLNTWPSEASNNTQNTTFFKATQRVLSVGVVLFETWELHDSVQLCMDVSKTILPLHSDHSDHFLSFYYDHFLSFYYTAS